ncbi:MAG: hypothetical protein A3K19_25930 [Lentisphaerae bacterium RIFOXYB12_FULL_65_16]|nr:MAG: hypothetical protein A3K18_06790 [Lentisphaerae bacterium RIFOXYA12_64_32]OGV92609.1 MAG: hypothetical protein A3K19_25930 [Lentisphaerae bacterium RIFOXYB12_FULL_65_16]
MSSIRILPQEVANRIAAGEVIERPASVVKELVENALDAGARRIVIQVAQGGRRLIQVSDDGSGMDRDDAMLCLEAHATSKIHESADIDCIRTLGFRGEALPSIASVSRFQLQTRRHEANSGTEVLVENGSLRDVRECGCAPGTNVRVSHLFANLPARRKFLQSVETENAHVHETVLLQALSHPGTAFDLNLDDREVLHVAGTEDTASRLGMLMGRDVLAATIPVDYEEGGIRVTGFAAKPGLTRSSRREQRVFVNGRPAAADSVYFGIRDAYHTMVMKGRYPPVVLHLELAPERVDVNVHPAKREVRFREDRLVGQVVAAALRRALRELAGEMVAVPQPPLAAGRSGGRFPDLQLTAGPEQPSLPLAPALTGWPSLAGVVPGPAPVAAPPTVAADATAPDGPPPAGSERAGPAPEEDVSAQADPGTAAALTGRAVRGSAGESRPDAATPPARGVSPSAATREEIRGLRVLGTLNQLYVVAEGSSGLVLIDQHAAHERILFERILRAAREADGQQQPLLLAVTVDLGPEDAAFLSRHIEHFQRLGFGLEPFGGNTFLVTGVPVHFPSVNVGGLLRDILDELRRSPTGAPRPDEVRIAQSACKHAVKNERTLADKELRQLLDELARAEMPYTCPHGRPVMINLPHAEIERRFGRQV